MTSTKGVSGTESASKILAFNSCQKNFEYEASIDNCITEAETKDFNVVNATRWAYFSTLVSVVNNRPLCLVRIFELTDSSSIQKFRN